jgi:hypothetical protein
MRADKQGKAAPAPRHARSESAEPAVRADRILACRLAGTHGGWSCEIEQSSRNFLPDQRVPGSERRTQCRSPSGAAAHVRAVAPGPPLVAPGRRPALTRAETDSGSRRYHRQMPISTAAGTEASPAALAAKLFRSLADPTRLSILLTLQT